MIKAIIIDDEEHNREFLKSLLINHCPNVTILAEAGSADSGCQLIETLNPQLVFLDIKMPIKNGFELLKQCKEINFEVIFVTAYNEFAINAFELNAIGYILKPIDASLLIKTVAKAEQLILSNSPDKTVSDFVNTLNNDYTTINKISVHQNDKVIYLNFEDLILLQVTEGYCEIFALDNQKYVTTKHLKMYENVFENHNQLMKVNKNCIINTKHVINYTKGEPCFVGLLGGHSIEISRRKKGDLLNLIKSI